MTITVFTPTYNRAYCLDRVFKSLKDQTFKNFEWLIVDDGSNDNTFEVVEKFGKCASFPIRYFYQENGGKHNAINKGVSEAKGEFIIIADSDDTFKANALECFYNQFQSIPNKENYAGIWCLVEDENGFIIGDKFPENTWDCDLVEFYFKKRIQGEKWQMIRTEVMKSHPMPDIRIKGLYVGESIMWMSISKTHLFRCVNIPLRIYHNSSDGIMMTSSKQEDLKWNGYYLQFQYFFNDYAVYFKYYPVYYIKGMVLFQYAIFRLGKSLYNSFFNVKGAQIKTLYLSVILVLPCVILYKQLKN